jgi:hypothetical protein
MSDMYDEDEFTDFDGDFGQVENFKSQLRLNIELHPSDLKRINNHNFLNSETINELVTRLLETFVETTIDNENKEMTKKRNNRCFI